jgi:hypothetical protein
LHQADCDKFYDANLCGLIVQSDFAGVVDLVKMKAIVWQNEELGERCSLASRC